MISAKESRGTRNEDPDLTAKPARRSLGARRLPAAGGRHETVLARQSFGTAPDGAPVELYTLSAGGGLAAKVLTYGGIVHELWVPGRDGEPSNVVLGFPCLADYVAGGCAYFGAIIGRYANRIANATFTLDGVNYRLVANEGPNCLHGGAAGFDKRVWREVGVRSEAGAVALALRYSSPDGEEGFPGALTVDVTHTVSRDNTLRIDYRATTKRPTVVNLTNHVYWNLSGEGAGSIDQHQLTVAASHYLPVDSALLPTGRVAPVAGTPLDFMRPASIGPRLREPSEQLALVHGLDHHFVLDQPRLRSSAAQLYDAVSGRRLDIATTEPGIQVYTGNDLEGALAGTSGRLYRQGDGIALETQHCPDSPNHPEFPSTVLRPGNVFTSTTVYRFSVD